MDTESSLNVFLKTEETPAAAPSGAIRKIRYTHDAMVDMLIAQPTISQNELALRFGYTAAWVSQIITSDAFQARLAERSEELIDPTIRASVEQRFKALVLRSAEIIAEKLNRPSSQIPDQLALRTLELASRAAGYGAKVEQTNVQVNVDTHLDELGGRLVQLLKVKKAEAIED